MSLAFPSFTDLYRDMPAYGLLHQLFVTVRTVISTSLRVARFGTLRAKCFTAATTTAMYDRSVTPPA